MFQTTVETATEEASVDSGSLPVETKNNVVCSHNHGEMRN